jgi:hypothetical protein
MKYKIPALFMTLLICVILICYSFCTVEPAAEETASGNPSGIVLDAGTADSHSQSSAASKRNKKDLRLQKNQFHEVLKNVAARPPAPEENEYKGEMEYDTEKLQEISRVVSASDPYYWERATETLETMLDSQEIDFRWTDEITEQVLDTLGVQESEGTALDSVDCRQSLCKITLIHENIDSHDEYYSGPFRSGDWVKKSANSHGERQAQEDGSFVSTVYFSKQDSGEAFLEMRKQIIADVNEESANQVQAEEKQQDTADDFGS